MSAGSLEVLGGAVLLLVSYAALAHSVGRRPLWRVQGWLVVAAGVWVVLATACRPGPLSSWLCGRRRC